MYNQGIVSSFNGLRQNHPWKQHCQGNLIDCTFNPPVANKSIARQWYGLDYSEEILFYRDTSFWNSMNQGLLLTDAGLYCIPDNNSPEDKIVFSWEAVRCVEYKDACIYFHGYNEGDVCPIHISFFTKNADDYQLSVIGPSIAEFLTRIASSVKHVDPFEENEQNVNGLVEKGNLDGAISLLKSLISQDDGQYKAYWYTRLTCIVGQKDGVDGNEQAIKYCLEGLKYCEEGSSLSVTMRNNLRLLSVSSCIEEVSNLDSDAPIVSMHNIRYHRCSDLWLSQNATDQTQYDDKLIKEAAEEDFECLSEYYCNNFIRQPYNERKVLLVVDEYTDLRQDSMCIMRKSDIPSNMSFPVGHPQVGQIYVGHPFIPAKYVPFEEYQLEFIEDKVREFTWLMQCMGATKISISAKNDNEQNGDYSSSQSVSGNTSYGIAKASGSFSGNSKGSFAEQISKAISLNQEFNPTKAPFIPDGLVWYQNEPSWQRLVNQRMTGSLMHASESIESRKSNMVNGSELKTIKAEFHSLVSLDGEWTREDEAKLQQQENATLTFEIDFAPVESLEAGTTQPTTSVSNSEVKKDVVDYYSLPFSMPVEGVFKIDGKGTVVTGKIASGRIHSGDVIYLVKDDVVLTATVLKCEMWRQLLDQAEYGDNVGLLIEGVDAGQVESGMTATAVEPKLSGCPSAEEQEYLEEVRECLADGEIGPRERKSLDRFAQRLGISPERAQELESTLSAPSITDDEKEYLEEVKLTLEDGAIGPRERKFLDRCASRLGISPDKAKEIESYAANF